MKVIGESSDSVIVQMSKDEAANLAGIHSAYTAEREGKKMAAGTEFSISEMYKNACDTLSFYRESKEMFTKAQNSIGRLLGFIAPTAAKGEKS